MNVIKKNNKYYFIKQNNKVCGIVGFKGLKFTAQQANSTVKFALSGTTSGAFTYNLKYSRDGINWNTFANTTNSTYVTVTLQNIGDFVYIKGNRQDNRSYLDGSYNYFVMTGKIAASGNIHSILEEDNFESITDLTKYIGPHGITSYCFNQLFYNCSALTTPPELPATTLVDWCYYSMFEGCSSLIITPQLHATTLMRYCYYSMFKNCNSIIKSLKILATSLKSDCFRQMFSGCSSLKEIDIEYTGNFSTTYFYEWVRGVSARGTFYYNGIDTSNFGVSAIPRGWTVQPFS